MIKLRPGEQRCSSAPPRDPGGETNTLARAGVSLGPEAAKVPENEAQVRRGQLLLDHVLVLVLVQASPISLYASRQSVAEWQKKP